jgi:hypothetical protein
MEICWQTCSAIPARYLFEHAFASNMLSLRKPMILAPYGRILAETWKASDDAEG